MNYVRTRIGRDALSDLRAIIQGGLAVRALARANPATTSLIPCCGSENRMAARRGSSSTRFSATRIESIVLRSACGSGVQPSRAATGLLRVLLSRIHATHRRMNPGPDRMKAICRRISLDLGTVNAMQRGVSLAPRTVDPIGGQMQATADRILPAWRTVNSIRGRAHPKTSRGAHGSMYTLAVASRSCRRFTPSLRSD
jgi:hypothetical protein